ncbi:hypothetical protein FNV43_RR18980 [Rhamnella rubrinervis]|uniref:NAD-dependent epimerase/dehydratase domain-containing protein n=1 Tax=Rhamnella rubrinervis TaxID=2594499 RepID=A0A8K0GY60_9ROSA|nr:hypothetical protein FNV43_RR18980 [Rhamnella rubrinervis]
MATEKGTVCVTGGTGFVGSWLISRLLRHGYSVTTTVRSHPDREPEEVVTKRSINGALGILKACLNSKTVKRVVYTSSAATVQFPSNAEAVDEVDESIWSDEEYIKKNGLEVVTLIPSFVVGPFICPKLPGSVWTTLAPVLGNEDGYGVLLKTCMVHVDDIASAQIFLLEHPDAKGRYTCSSDVVTLESLAELLSAKYPEFHMPSKESIKEIKGHKIFPTISSKKLRDCGFKFEYGVEEVYSDAIRCCKEKGYL